MTELKLVVLGEGGIGKSAIVIRFAANQFLEEYDPTIEDSYRKQLVVDEQVYLLDILDTAGREDSVQIRERQIQYGAFCLLAYSITSSQSFDAMAEYVPLILRVQKTEKPRAVLVATKSDLEAERVVTQSKGEEFARELGIPFIETSALLNKNVTELFSEVVRMDRRLRKEAKEKRPTSKSKCSIL